MIVINNTLLPFKGYKAINLFGIILFRKGNKLDRVIINHERIHTAQMLEMLFLLFYIWYLVEYLIRLLIYRNHRKAYRKISFEQEAYNHASNEQYLQGRKHYAWMKHLGM